jgi:hypothetical protein
MIAYNKINVFAHVEQIKEFEQSECLCATANINAYGRLISDKNELNKTDKIEIYRVKLL